ncbi:hypothetical protein NMY22_g17809 [Coprinellus aureogranulatus]|nr:hypothetical protein NMY22_g17809 [Coprinellus aureogranulatus]
MRTTVLFAFFLAFVVSFVAAAPPRGLNARRMAEGLGPLPPVRRSRTAGAARSVPSGVSVCPAPGLIQCCNSVGHANDGLVGLLLGLLGIVVKDLTVLIGVTCSPNPPTCNSQLVCCTNNGFNGVVAIGCTPVNNPLR